MVMCMCVCLTGDVELKEFHVDDRSVPRRQSDVVSGDAAPKTASRHLDPHADTGPVQQTAQHVPEQTREQIQLRRGQRPTQRQQTTTQLGRRLYIAALLHNTGIIQLYTLTALSYSQASKSMVYSFLRQRSPLP